VTNPTIADNPTKARSRKVAGLKACKITNFYRSSIMTQLTEYQLDCAKDVFRDFVLTALDDAARDVKRRIVSLDTATGPILGVADKDLPELFRVLDKLCLSALVRVGVTAVGDELFWPDDAPLK